MPRTLPPLVTPRALVFAKAFVNVFSGKVLSADICQHVVYPDKVSHDLVSRYQLLQVKEAKSDALRRRVASVVANEVKSSGRIRS